MLKRENKWDISQYYSPDSKKKKIDCPYLSTIKRYKLDFDSKKVCSITISAHNIYCCLVCGLYFQGRGKHTPAFIHSLEKGHHLFISFVDHNIYSLPDNYEVVDWTLQDIQYNLSPKYSELQIKSLDQELLTSKSLEGQDYMPGYVGLNNLKNTDYVNVILQMLSATKALRNFFLLYSDDSDTRSDLNGILTQKIADLIKKMWNPKNFKGHVCPQEFMQAVSEASGKRFKIIEQKEPAVFLPWFMHSLNSYLLSRKKSPIVFKSFQGEIEIRTSSLSASTSTKDSDSKLSTKPFWILTLDLPTLPLYKEATEGLLNKPRCEIASLLKKFNGSTPVDDAAKGTRSTYHLKKLPPYLVLCVRRFIKNDFFVEKNSILVEFPLDDLDLTPFLKQPPAGSKTVKYSVIAQIVHEGKLESGSYKIQVRHRASNDWFEIQDLSVLPIMPEQVALSETYMLLLEHRS